MFPKFVIFVRKCVLTWFIFQPPSSRRRPPTICKAKAVVCICFTLPILPFRKDYGSPGKSFQSQITKPRSLKFPFFSRCFLCRYPYHSPFSFVVPFLQSVLLLNCIFPIALQWNWTADLVHFRHQPRIKILHFNICWWSWSVLLWLQILGVHIRYEVCW